MSSYELFMLTFLFFSSCVQSKFSITENDDTASPSTTDDTGDIEDSAENTDTSEPEDTADSGDIIETPEPEISDLTLSPSPVYTNDTLEASAILSSSSDAQTILSWEWFINESLSSTTSETLSGIDHFSKHDVIEVYATPEFDGLIGSTQMTSIIVSNTPPTQPSISINPQGSLEEENDLICHVDIESTDDDLDAISYAITWQKNTSPFSETSTTSINDDTILAENIQEGEEWTCTITPNDGEENGTSISETVTIEAAAVTYASCSTSLASLGSSTTEGSASGGGSQGIGAWVAESHPNAAEQYWTFMDYDNDTLSAYSSLSDLQNGTNPTTIILDEDWSGVGHVVHDNILYYNQTDSPTIIAFDLISGAEIIQADIPDASYDTSYTYSSGGKTDIDLAIDQGYLYAIYSTQSAAGKIVVSQLDMNTLNVLSTHTASSALKNDYSAMFIACGVLYGVDSTVNGPCFWCTDTTIDLAWELSSTTESIPYIDFHNPGSSGYIGGVQYNQADGLIYVTRGGQLGRITPSWN
jgi:hypothetical protein